MAGVQVRQLFILSFLSYAFLFSFFFLLAPSVHFLSSLLSSQFFFFPPCSFLLQTSHSYNLRTSGGTNKQRARGCVCCAAVCSACSKTTRKNHRLMMSEGAAATHLEFSLSCDSPVHSDNEATGTLFKPLNKQRCSNLQNLSLKWWRCQRYYEFQTEFQLNVS